MSFMVTYHTESFVKDIYFDRIVTFYDVNTDKFTDVLAKYTGCVFVDIDGTVADNSHRKRYVEVRPKNHEKYNSLMGKDTPINTIIHKVRELYDSGWKVVMCTGRPDSHYEITAQWLYEHDVPYHAMYMRKDGDRRQDYIVKAELLEKATKDGFSPSIVLEDRNQVVDMWRAQGIRCIQVAHGDF